jgi:hypothetical protein
MNNLKHASMCMEETAGQFVVSGRHDHILLMPIRTAL